MNQHRIGALPVVDENNICVGIITERDFIRLIANQHDFFKPVSDVMTRTPITIHPDATVYEAINIMHTHNIRHLPVIDKEGRLIGIISMRDLLVIGEHE